MEERGKIIKIDNILFGTSLIVIFTIFILLTFF